MFTCCATVFLNSIPVFFWFYVFPCFCFPPYVNVWFASPVSRYLLLPCVFKPVCFPLLFFLMLPPVFSLFWLQCLWLFWVYLCPFCCLLDSPIIELPLLCLLCPNSSPPFSCTHAIFPFFQSLLCCFWLILCQSFIWVIITQAEIKKKKVIFNRQLESYF